jgi:NitT/TauT family transport system permease protein
VAHPSGGPSDRFLRPVLLFVLGLAVACLAWQLIIVACRIPPYLVPSPEAVFNAFRTQWRTILSHAGYTLSSAALGLCASVTLATSLAVAFSINRNLADAAAPIVFAFRSMPVTAIAPIMMLALGRGIATSVVVVSIVSFFPLLVNLSRGLASSDRSAEQLLHIYNASRWQRLRFLHVPYALPFLFTGLRVAGASAILGAMLSEWITGLGGLGNLILDSGELRETALLWAAVLTSAFTALCVFWLTSAGERRLLHWRQ